MLNPNLQMIHETEGRADLDSLLGSLLSVLRKEIEIYGELAEAVALEADMLRRPSLESLHESNARKETCILKTRLLEEVRMKTVGRIASALGLDERGSGYNRSSPRRSDLAGTCGTATRSCARSPPGSGGEPRNRGLLDASLRGRAGTGSSAASSAGARPASIRGQNERPCERAHLLGEGDPVRHLPDPQHGQGGLLASQVGLGVTGSNVANA
ncbi:MAG: flagellar export chaperone FlgN [Syntrophaceae bacterium]|nr:flagellar export chaperone FlgN [Syntrophaceae bacterium]